MSTLLVTAASRHGATTEVARVLASTLRAAGQEAVVLEPGAVTDLEAFDAVVLGSAVYYGHWMPEATELVERLDTELASKPLWLFSVGPLGEPPKPVEAPLDAEAIRERLGARAHRIFPGELVKARLGLAEKLVVRAVGAAEGDFRPWDGIVAWGDEIAAAMAAERATVGAR